MKSRYAPSQCDVAARLSQSGRSRMLGSALRAMRSCDVGWTAICDFWPMRLRVDLPDNQCRQMEGSVTSGNEPAAQGEMTCQEFHARLPPEAAATDPEVLRSGLIREAGERRRAECLAHMQAEVVQ